MSLSVDMASTDLDVADGVLIERARRGDGMAFEGLVRRHFRAAYAVALAILGNREDAEDVCQDAFIRALERLDGCRHPDRFAAWLLQIVRNGARNYVGYRRVRAAAPLEVVSAAASESPSRDLERKELRETLQLALGELSEMQRQVVLLHDLEGWKHWEIAEELGVSEGMSRQHLFGARRIVRSCLGAGFQKEYVNG